MNRAFGVGMFAIMLAAASLPFSIAIAAPTVQPSAPPVRPVTETLWGQAVTDNYRYMEQLGPETIDWMKGQGAYARILLDSIGPRAALGARVAAFTGGFEVFRGYAAYGGRSFIKSVSPVPIILTSWCARHAARANSRTSTP